MTICRNTICFRQYRFEVAAGHSNSVSSSRRINDAHRESEMLRFIPTEGYQVAGHRQVLVGPNPLDGAIDNICDHIGGFVEVDAKIYRIVEVDVFPKSTPPALGERVGLL